MQHSQERSVTNLPCYNREHENASKEEQLHLAYLRLLGLLISRRKSNRGARVVICRPTNGSTSWPSHLWTMWVMSTTNREPRLSFSWPRPHKKMEKNFWLVSRDNFKEVPSKGLITWAGLARLSGLVSVCRDLGTFVKRNKTQLHDYMTTGPVGRFSKDPVTYRARKVILKTMIRLPWKPVLLICFR